MRFQKFRFTLALLAATVCVPLTLNLALSFSSSPVLAQSHDSRKAQADRLLQQGNEQYQTSRFEAALQSWQQALVIYRNIHDRKGEGVALGNLGSAYYALDDYGKAIDYHQQALAIARAIRNRKGEGNALNNLGDAYDALDDYGKAIDYYQQSLALAQAINDRKGEGTVLGNLGLAYYTLGNYGKAIDYYQRSLAIARAIHDRLGEGQSLGNLGSAYYTLGDYGTATDYYQRSLTIARAIHNRLGEGNALGNLGNAYFSRGDYGKAIDYQQQSLALARAIHDRLGEGNALGNLGNAYFSRGDYGTAIDYYQQRLVFARAIHDRLGEGNTLGNLGNVYNALGDYGKAIDYHQQSLAIARSIHNRLGEGQSLGNLGIAYDALGDYGKAIDYHQQSLALARAIHNRLGEEASLGNLGAAYHFLGDYGKAIDYHQQSLAIARAIHDREGEGDSLGNLGNIYDFLGDYSKAIDYHQQSLAIARAIHNRLGEEASLDNLGTAYDDLGNRSKAIEYQQQSLALARTIHDRLGEGQSLNNLGLALRGSGKLQEAANILRTGIAVWEAQRKRLGANDTNKVSIFEAQARTYRLLQTVLVALHQADTALEVAERGRARAFVELLAQRSSIHPSAAAAIPPLTLHQMQQTAKVQNATLVEYSIIDNNFKVGGKQQNHEDQLYIWVIKPTGEVTFRQADLKPLWQKQHITLANLVTSSREAISVRGRGRSPDELVGVVPTPGATPNSQLTLNPKAQLQSLHRLLIAPIADLLPHKESDRIIFLPQKALFLVPFPALQAPDGKYLIQQHTILTAPAIQVLDFTHQRRQQVPGAARDVLVVGNPTMPLIQPPGQASVQLPPLAGAAQEAQDIAGIFKTKAFVGDGATKAFIIQQLPKAKIIHLATHGLIDDFKGVGVPGAIALAPDKNGVPNDGLLTSNEILDLHLNAQLVVLSACDTGRGRITGDGVIGLSRSLITAGVPSVIVSLWSVPDAPTASLMREFYTNLQHDPDKAQALRQAMLTTMKQHPDPKDWAAFTLIGESQ